MTKKSVVLIYMNICISMSLLIPVVTLVNTVLVLVYVNYWYLLSGSVSVYRRSMRVTDVLVYM